MKRKKIQNHTHIVNQLIRDKYSLQKHENIALSLEQNSANNKAYASYDFFSLN